MPTDVFISYSSRDVALAKPMCSALEAAGLSCWMAPRNISPGQTWSEAIMDGINGCEVMVLLYTSNSIISPQVLREVERAVSKRLGLIAFRAENVPPTRAMEYLVSVSHWQEAYSGSLDLHLPTLASSIQALMAARKSGEACDTPVHPSATPPPPLPPNNLPPVVTSFVGREAQIEEVRELLNASRLVTLLGSGGIGKTRLALKAAEAALPQYHDGVWLVELAALTDGSLVAQTAAKSLGLQEQAGETIEQTLLEYLRKKTLLLLLDNCEHLAQDCARLSEALLQGCPDVRLLLTSREKLGITGEKRYRVPPLSAPNPKQVDSAEALMKFEATRLFMERAVAVSPAFGVTSDSAPLPASICRHLDGIPLAIELAAARVRSLPLEEILNHLDSHFRLLTKGKTTALPRHQTLRAMIDWSYDLLNAQEKTLLNRLSIFAGGWSLDAARQVCVDDQMEEWDVMDGLDSLIDKSLVVAEPGESSLRYRMLESIRQYGAEKRHTEGDELLCRKQHRDCFLRLAEEAPKKLTGAKQTQWLQRLEVEHDNLRAALDWCTATPEQTESGLRLAGALPLFWELRGYFSEGRERFAALLQQAGASGPTAPRAKALIGSGQLAWYQGDYVSSQRFYQESLQIAEAIQDRDALAWALRGLGDTAKSQGDDLAARLLYDRCLALYRELADQQGMAATLTNQGNILYNLKEYETARAYFKESRALFQQLGDQRQAAMALSNLGRIALVQGDYETARRYEEQNLAIQREVGDKIRIGVSLHNLAGILLFQGDWKTAQALLQQSLQVFIEFGSKPYIAETLENLSVYVQDQPAKMVFLYGAAQALREAIHAPLAAQCRANRDFFLAMAATVIGQDAFEEAWQEGRSLPLEQVTVRALEAPDESENPDIERRCKQFIASTLEEMAGHKEDDPAGRIRLLSAADTIREEIAVPLPDRMRSVVDSLMAKARAVLCADAFEAVWQEGHALTLEEATDCAIQEWMERAFREEGKNIKGSGRL